MATGASLRARRGYGDFLIARIPCLAAIRNYDRRRMNKRKGVHHWHLLRFSPLSIPEPSPSLLRHDGSRLWPDRPLTCVTSTSGDSS